MKHPEITVAPCAYLAAAAGILLLPLRWLICAAFAAAWHELFHILLLLCFHIPVSEVRVGVFGAAIRTGAMTAVQEILCAAAGPLASFSLLLTAKWFPLLSLFGLVQGLFNLIPIYPLDGGRIVKAVIRFVSSERTYF